MRALPFNTVRCFQNPARMSPEAANALTVLLSVFGAVGLVGVLLVAVVILAYRRDCEYGRA